MYSNRLTPAAGSRFPRSGMQATIEITGHTASGCVRNGDYA
jgi:hypothetical protein